MLGHHRVLDLSDGGALLCGQVLADLGADVLQIEPPGGAAARRLGPFAGGTPDPERSLFWWSYARGKCGLDLDAEAGRRELLELASRADVLIESAAPGAMAARGLGYAELAARNPALVVASITPFGQDGPKADHPATDLIVLAAAGPLALTGDDDRAPVRVVVPQAFLHAGAEAAVAALVALHERVASGLGQHVDVSAQQAATLATQANLLAEAVGASPNWRISGGVLAGPLRVEFTYPAKDGYVSITHLFGSTVGPATRRLMEWVFDCGGCDEATRDKDWVGYAALLMAGEEPLEEFARVKRTIAACTASKTKAELLQVALERNLLMAPVYTVREVIESEQLAARGYLQRLEAPVGEPVRHPGPFAKFSAAPLRYRRRAPRLDEHAANAGKRMLTLDLTRPEARDVVLDLVRWADVVCESFTPKGMMGFGLDYAALRTVKPDVIMLSSCLMGQSGPLTGFAGYGNLAAAATGFYELTGWPDRPPAGPFGAYTDYIAPRYNAAAILAALEHRRITGEGQHIDLSQAEASLHFLAPAILDYTVNGTVATRDGNRDREMAPHGVYPCAGEDRWIALAVRDDSDWRALAEAMGRPELADDARFASAEARLTRRDELDALLAAATAPLGLEALEAQLVARGIPASRVATSADAVRDPQLAHRGHFVPLAHPTRGRTVVEGSRFRLSRTPPRVADPAPSFGDGTQWVLETVLGYDNERIAELAIAGALE